MSLLHTKPEVAAQERMVDDGNGKVEVRLARATLGPWDVPAAEEGSLFCRHCTILCSLRGLELALPPTTFRKVRDAFPQWLSPR